jgi:hypothetical protein
MTMNANAPSIRDVEGAGELQSSPHVPKKKLHGEKGEHTV